MRRGIGLVELLVAMLLTMIIGGAATTLLRSGMDIESRTISGVLTQRSLGLPYLELLSEVERASLIELLSAPPSRETLEQGESVVFLSQSDTQERRFLILRTKAGDRRLPGFYYLSKAEFEKTASEDNSVLFALTAAHNDRTLEYESYLHSLNKAPVSADTGVRYPVLKLSLGEEVASLQLEFARIKLANGNPIPPHTTFLLKNIDVVGEYLLRDLFGGQSPEEVEFEWRVYDSPGDAQSRQNAVVVAKGTSTETPTESRLIEEAWVGKYLAFWVKFEDQELQSDYYIIYDKPQKTGPFWGELVEDLFKGDIVADFLSHAGNIAAFNIERQTENGEIYYLLKGKSRPYSPAFFTKKLEEKFFNEGVRSKHFCLENYTILIDARVRKTGGSKPGYNNWGALISGQRGSEGRSYGYCFDFAPIFENDKRIDIKNKDNSFFYNASLGLLFNNGNRDLLQGCAVSKLRGESAYAQGNSWERFGIGSIFRRNEPNNETREFENDTSTGNNHTDPKSIYFWGDLSSRNEFSYVDDARKGMNDVRYTTEITVLTRTEQKSGGDSTEAKRIYFRIRIFENNAWFFDRDTMNWEFDQDAKRSKTMWFGADSQHWHLPDPDRYDMSQPGDARFELQEMPQGKIDEMPIISNYFGMRYWWDDGTGLNYENAEIDLFFVDILPGFKAGETLPDGRVIWLEDSSLTGTIMDHWDPERPFVNE